MLKNIILNNVFGPTKMMDLMAACKQENYEYSEIIAAVKQLVYEGHLIEISYRLPNQHCDHIGILFPKGTEIIQQTSNHRFYLHETRT